ncbi:hypothetical protein ACFO5K_23895 [Nocardia halotolerans]|uniref:Mce-associated membrane protein n=1 Tax=Nocardia halotolerans TaxID=1755878 RepID=A0ABV8VQD9_9NOCA
MNDNDNRRPRRRAARSAGPPVEDAAAETVTISKSEPVSPGSGVNGAEAGVQDSTGAAAANTVRPADPTVKFAETAVRSTDATVKSSDTTVNLAAAESEPPVDLTKSADPAPARARGRIFALAAAVVLVLALVGGAGFAAFSAYSVDRDEDLRAQYTETARQAVLNLTTIRAETAKEDIDRILAVASGDFKAEFDGRVEPFMGVVQEANVVSSGDVVESGIVSADDESAQVLVAAKQTVSNKGSPEPQSRQYRFRVTVANADAGMTVSKVEFVG